MLKIAICDDEQHICSQIESLVLECGRKYWNKVEIEIFTSGESLIENLRRGTVYDFIFLDIELGKINGLTVAHIVREELLDYVSEIIFVSGTVGYDRALFAVQPFYFIEKPIQEDSFIKCVMIMKNKMKEQDSHFVYTKNTEIVKVSIRDILYFEGQNNRVCITTIHKTDKFYKRLEDVKQEVPTIFFSPHRSYLVNYDNVEKITNQGIHLRGCDIEIPISRRKLQEVREMQMRSERRT